MCLSEGVRTELIELSERIHHRKNISVEDAIRAVEVLKYYGVDSGPCLSCALDVVLDRYDSLE